MKGNAHDQFFKAMLSELEMAQAFFQFFCPKEMTDLLDFSTLELSSNSYVDEELKEAFSDMVFTCRFREREKRAGIHILLEHKSYRDERVLFQVMGYLSGAYLKQIKEGKDLELVVPLVFYHGRAKWDFKQMEQRFETVLEPLRCYIPAFTSLFVDMRLFSENDLRRIKLGSLVAGLMMQKYSGVPHELERKAHEIFNVLDEVGEGNFIHSLVVYFYNVTRVKKEKLKSILMKVKEPMEQKFKSTYDMIMEEGMEKGIEKGIEKGREEIIQNFISEGFSVKEISRITKLSVDDIHRMLKS